MLPRTFSLRAGALTVLVALTTGLLGPSLVSTADAELSAAPAAGKHHQDPRKTRGLFVDPLMPANKHGAPYASRIGKYAQALWIIPEAYGTPWVKDTVRQYTERANHAHKTPMLTVYGIPGRDCGQYSSKNPLKTTAEYRGWIKQLGKGLEGQKAMVILEPDALPLFSSTAATCPTTPTGWQGMLRFASKQLSKSGAWVYLDAGHSNWTPYDSRPTFLKNSGIKYARGFSTNVSNFRKTGVEKTYASTLLKGLRQLGIKGKHYIVDTSRNGGTPSADGNDVINPTWARLGAPPKLVFQGAFDGTLWVKHPGESDGTVNGGPSSGVWCNMLADRLVKGSSNRTYC